MEMAYALKNGLVRIDLQTKDGASPAIIMDAAKQAMTLLMTEQKMDRVQSMPKPKDADFSAASTGVALEKTGITETIAGYVGEKYRIKSKDFTGEIWLTDQLGAFMGMGNPIAHSAARNNPAAVGQSLSPAETCFRSASSTPPPKANPPSAWKRLWSRKPRGPTRISAFRPIGKN